MRTNEKSDQPERYKVARDLLLRMSKVGLVLNNAGNKDRDPVKGYGSRPVMNRTESESSVTRMLDAISLSSHLSQV